MILRTKKVKTDIFSKGKIQLKSVSFTNCAGFHESTRNWNFTSLACSYSTVAGIIFCQIWMVINYLQFKREMHKEMNADLKYTTNNVFVKKTSSAFEHGDSLYLLMVCWFLTQMISFKNLVRKSEKVHTRPHNHNLHPHPHEKVKIFLKLITYPRVFQMLWKFKLNVMEQFYVIQSVFHKSWWFEVNTRN